MGNSPSRLTKTVETVEKRVLATTRKA